MFDTILILIGTLALISLSYSCKIVGQSIGQCLEKNVLGSQSFCGDYVRDYICVPLASV